MFSMFSPDSRFMQLLSRFADLVILNILFLLCCLPVITAGPALVALYASVFRFLREEEGRTVRYFFSSLKRNLRQGIALGIITAVITVPAAVYFDACYHMDGPGRWGFVLFALIGILGAMTAAYAFPWASRFENTTGQVLKNGLILSVTNLPRTVCILVIQLTPLFLWAVYYDFFLKISFLFLALYFAAGAYLTAALLLPVFKPYWETA